MPTTVEWITSGQPSGEAWQGPIKWRKKEMGEMRLLTMKSLRTSGLDGARKWSYRTAGLVMAALMGGSLATALAASPALAQTPGPAAGVNMGAAATGASSV